MDHFERYLIRFISTVSTEQRAYSERFSSTLQYRLKWIVLHPKYTSTHIFRITFLFHAHWRVIHSSRKINYSVQFPKVQIHIVSMYSMLHFKTQFLSELLFYQYTKLNDVISQTIWWVISYDICTCMRICSCYYRNLSHLVNVCPSLLLKRKYFAQLRVCDRTQEVVSSNLIEGKICFSHFFSI